MAHKHMMNMPKSMRRGMPHYDEEGNYKPPKKTKKKGKKKGKK